MHLPAHLPKQVLQILALLALLTFDILITFGKDKIFGGQGTRFCLLQHKMGCCETKMPPEQSMQVAQVTQSTQVEMNQVM